MNAAGQRSLLDLDGVGPETRRDDLGEGCNVDVWERFARDEHAQWFARLRQELPWVQELYARGGRVVPAPRLTSFHGDPSCSYVYSGIAYEPQPLSGLLRRIRDRVQEATGYGFNSVLANHYRDGRDSVGYHADDEPELGPEREDIVIASLSLGARRRFVLKHKRRALRRSYELGEGALLVMSGRTQLDWVHALPKTARPVGPRINLTFRIIQSRAG